VAALTRCALAAALCCLSFVPRASAQLAAGEYQIKAAFLHHFASFVDWPADAMPASAPIVIGLIGDDPFGHAIDDVITAKSVVNGHRVSVRRLRWNDPIANCQIVFISSSELEHLDAILEELKERSVLTVADLDGFAQRGGIIELRTSSGRVKFDINTSAAAAAHLKISSKLLQVARVVYSDIATGGAR